MYLCVTASLTWRNPDFCHFVVSGECFAPYLWYLFSLLQASLSYCFCHSPRVAVIYCGCCWCCYYCCCCCWCRVVVVVVVVASIHIPLPSLMMIIIVVIDGYFFLCYSRICNFTLFFSFFLLAFVMFSTSFRLTTNISIRNLITSFHLLHNNTSISL